MPMKISKIEFENFRNFKDHGEIRCSTDGKVTIIYGRIGDGKTTLHQLVQWVFYGRVHFNKTATDRLYNLQYENDCSFGETFDVMGCVDFEHDGAQYSLRRTYTYRKGLSDSAKIAEDLALTKMDEDYNWRRMDKPNSVIETLLPSGLSDYFFFDGETMIADLRVKGKDSASKLRKALYSMFDLDVLEAAIDHIGRTDLKTTVLGKLYLNKGTIASGGQIAAVKTNIENAQNRIDRFTRELEQAQAKKAEMQALLVNVSEQIGGFKSKADYERQRKALKTQRDTFLKNATDIQGRFGDAVLDIILYQVNYRFLFPFCHLGKLSCAAPGVGDVGHDIVRLLDHPFVSPRDSEARVDSFDALWKHSVGVIACIKLITLWGHTLQNDSVIDVGV